MSAHDEVLLDIAAARLWAAHRFPYFTTALFALVPVVEPDIGTVAVDGHWRLYADPEVVAGMDVSPLGVLLVHHVGHLLRQHAGRAESAGIGEDRAAAWNDACDAEINDDLVAEDLPVPSGQLEPGGAGWPTGELAESYLARIRKRAAGADGHRDCGSGAHGHARPWDHGGDGTPGVSASDAALLRRRTAEVVAAHVRAAGHVPAGLRRWADDLISPVVDWRRVLAAEVRRGLKRAAGCADYTFARRSRRATCLGDVVLPGTFRPAPEVAVVVDTSASMAPAMLSTALAEVEGILAAGGLAARRLTVLSCDTEVGAVSQATRASQVELVGGGGTDMGAGLAAAADLRPHPQVVVVLTDGWTPWPARAPRAVSVVVGLLADPPLEGGGVRRGPTGVPSWARTVRIDGALIGGTR